MTLFVARDIQSLEQAFEMFQGKPRAFVPTMGALHRGHGELIKTAAASGEACVVVSVFVNPTQFAAHEDLSTYPRTEENDKKLIERAGGHIAFIPDVATIYPPERTPLPSFDSPFARGLEGDFRPHFFGGVTQVVGRLFDIVRPQRAYFGEKDFQQLKVIESMATVQYPALHVHGVPTVREEDGLAFSSRNVYLSPEHREKAVVLPAVLKEVSEALRQGVPPATACAQGTQRLLQEGFARVDYLAVYDETSWTDHTASETPLPLSSAVRILAAAVLGTTRLIDNISVY